MNWSAFTDPFSSLDGFAETDDFVHMSNVPDTLYIQRIDAERNMARYYTYTLSIQPTLFGDVSVVRNWGRIGTRGREKVQLFSEREEAVTSFQQIARQKLRKGYRAVSPCR